MMVIRRSDLPNRVCKYRRPEPFSEPTSQQSSVRQASTSSESSIALESSRAPSESGAPFVHQSRAAASFELDEYLQRRLDQTKYLRVLVEKAKRTALERDEKAPEKQLAKKETAPRENVAEVGVPAAGDQNPTAVMIAAYALLGLAKGDAAAVEIPAVEKPSS